MKFLRKSGLFLLLMVFSCNADLVLPSSSLESLGDTQPLTKKTLTGDQSQEAESYREASYKPNAKKAGVV